jgi:hypothetical protein
MICTNNSKFLKTGLIFCAATSFSFGYASAPADEAETLIALLASSGQVVQTIPVSPLQNTMDSLVPDAFSSEGMQDEKKSFHVNSPFTRFSYQSFNVRDANLKEYFQGYKIGGSGTYVFSSVDDNASYQGSVGQKTNVTSENFTMSYYRNKNLVVGAQLSLCHSHTKLNKNSNNLRQITKDNLKVFF